MEPAPRRIDLIESAFSGGLAGLLLFVVSSVGKIRLGPVMWEVLPFLAWSLIVLALTIVFPPLTTWLPGQIK